MRRKDREMPIEVALEVCDSCEFAVLSVVDTARLPYAVPLNTVRDGMNIYFHCAKVGKKIDALNNNNNVCLSFVSNAVLAPEQFTTKYKSAVVFGKAFEVFDEDEKIHALKILCEKFAPSNMPAFDGEMKASFSHTGVWKIEIAEITGKSNMK